MLEVMVINKQNLAQGYIILKCLAVGRAKLEFS